MPTPEQTQLLLALIGLFTQICILAIFFLNRKTLTQTFFANNHNLLVEQLQREEVRQARQYVSTLLYKKEFSDESWTNHDKQMASIVCGAYGTVGVYLALNNVRIKDIITYKLNIIDCYAALEPFILDRRSKSGEPYWKDFQHLAETMKSIKK